MTEDVEISAKLKLDTTEAEAKIKSLDSTKKSKKKSVEVDLPKDTKIELPKDATKGLKELFTGDTGFKNIGKLAKGAAGGFHSLGGSLASILQKTPKIAGIVTLILAAVSAIIKLVSGTDSFKKMIESMKELSGLLKTLLAPVLQFVYEVTRAVNDLLLSLQPVFDILAALIKIALTPILGVLKLVMALLEPVLELLQLLLEPFKQLFELIADGLDTLWAYAVDFIKDVLKPVVDFFKMLANAIKEFFKTVRDFLGIGSKSLYTTTGREQNGIKTSLDAWETVSADGLTEGERQIIESIEETGDKVHFNVGDFFMGFADKIRDTVLGLFDYIKNGWEDIKNFAKNVWTNIKNVATDFWAGVKEVAANVWSVIGTVASKVWDGIKNVATDVWSGIKNIATDVWGAISVVAIDVFGALKRFISNIFGGVGGETKGFENIPARWENGYNFGDITGTVVDAVVGSVDAVVDWVKNLFGFADGGTLQLGAQVWGMNEKGNPEFMFNAGGHDTVINKEILSDAMFSALVKANETTSKQVIEVSVKQGAPAGPRELAQWLLPSLQFALKK